MGGTYIKLNLTNNWGEVKGGVYLDSITAMHEHKKDKDRTTLRLSGVDAYVVVINKPLEEVEQMLADAKYIQMIAERNLEPPKTMNWRHMSGEPPKPAKEPKRRLSKAFGHN